DARRALAAPVARIQEALWLAARGLPTAMLDLSDGLAGDAGHIASASGVAIVLEADAIPIHPAAAHLPEGLQLALSGGEDYELCFTAAPGALTSLEADFEEAFGVDLTRVGAVEPGEGVYLREADGSRSRLVAGGFQHFRSD